VVSMLAAIKILIVLVLISASYSDRRRMGAKTIIQEWCFQLRAAL